MRKLLSGNSESIHTFVLWLSDRNGEHSFGDLLAALEHARVQQGRTVPSLHRHRDHSRGAEEGALGSQVDSFKSALCGAACCICGRRRHLLLRILLCYFLAQKTRAHARTLLFK